MSVNIVPATMRDLSYIASNLRPDDYREVDCQFEQWSPAFIAAASLAGRHAYCVEINGNPEAAFGACKGFNSPVWHAWSWGTKRMWRAVPAITAYAREVMLPDLLDQGAWRMEARAMVEHESAHRWLVKMGAKPNARLKGWGKNGEDFILFEWTRDDVHSCSHAETRTGCHAAAA